MEAFLSTWSKSAVTSVGLFWMAFWAFGLGYLISSLIQVFVSRERMKRTMGESGPRSVALGTGFGFISSSCSFAALATTRALFVKGAGLIPSLAFLLASTNLVIELGIVIGVFLGWQFIVGEYVGGILLILLMWLLVRVTFPTDLVDEARSNARESSSAEESSEVPDWKDLVTSLEGWQRVANRYMMEWKMVWKDVTIGFTVAGVIAAFVPTSFFQALFVGSGGAEPGFLDVLLQALVGPVAAFFTFIGSMGNIPLAAVLFDNGVSFAGIMAFIFSDLVVFPVVRIQAKYYGWKMALYILAVFLAVLIASSLILYYAFELTGYLPKAPAAAGITEREFFSVDYTFFLNVIFLLVSAAFFYFSLKGSNGGGGAERGLVDKALLGGAIVALIWLVVGLALPLAGLGAGG